MHVDDIDSLNRSTRCKKEKNVSYPTEQLSITKLYCPRPEPRVEILLSHKPRIMSLPLRTRMLQLKLEPAQKARHKLINFQQADILANARPRARTKLQHGTLHFPELVGRSVDPALWAESVDVCAKDFRPAM